VFGNELFENKKWIEHLGQLSDEISLESVGLFSRPVQCSYKTDHIVHDNLVLADQRCILVEI